MKRSFSGVLLTLSTARLTLEKAGNVTNRLKSRLLMTEMSLFGAKTPSTRLTRGM